MPHNQYFTYDSLDRLTSADATGGQNGLYAETYTYDALTGNLASKAGNTYTYGDTSHAHAVTGLSNGSAYTYDANGNQITRIVGTDSYTHIYDAENKLIQVVKNGNTLAEFTYDGDGTRVASTINGVTTKFVGEYYEVSGTDVTKYYGGKTAMRKNGVVTYLLSDHLGSNSLIMDSSGNMLSETRYKALGELRYSTGTTTTPYTYTGQYSNTADFGWMYYKARWYDSSLGRFSQADTIVQNTSFPGSYDRYAYTMNNPVRFTDPSGYACRDDGTCVLGPGDRLPAKSTLLNGGTNTSKTSAGTGGSSTQNQTLGIGFQQSVEEELFWWRLLFGGHISGGMTSSDSINTASDITLLLEQENGQFTGVEFDSDYFFGGYNLNEGFLLGGRTPSLNYLFGLAEGTASNHFAGSCSVDLSEGLWNSEVTISIYPTDITTSAGAFEGEVMAGYYLNYTPAKLVATHEIAKVGFGVLVAAVYITRGALIPIINSFNNWAPKGATP